MNEQEALRDFARMILESIEKAYQDPELRKEFEEWKKGETK